MSIFHISPTNIVVKGARTAPPGSRFQSWKWCIPGCCGMFFNRPMLLRITFEIHISGRSQPVLLGNRTIEPPWLFAFTKTWPYTTSLTPSMVVEPGRRNGWPSGTIHLHNFHCVYWDSTVHCDFVLWEQHTLYGGRAFVHNGMMRSGSELFPFRKNETVVVDLIDGGVDVSMPLLWTKALHRVCSCSHKTKSQWTAPLQ